MNVLVIQYALNALQTISQSQMELVVNVIQVGLIQDPVANSLMEDQESQDQEYQYI